MQRYVRSEMLPNPLRFIFKLRIGIVQARNQKRCDLKPDASLMLQIHQGIKHRLQMAAADSAVKLLGKALQIHVGGIHVPVKLAAGFGTHVSGRHGDGLDPQLVPGVGHSHGILHENCRVVVGISKARAAQPLRGLRQGLGHGEIGEPVHFAGLGHIPVLAEFAGQITAGSAEGKHRGTGQKMIERLFLDWINAKTAGTAIAEQLDLVLFASAHEAQTTLALVQLAGARAYIALDTAVLKPVPIAGGNNSLGNGVHDGYFVLPCKYMPALTIRPPAVAGAFYPEDAQKLRAQLKHLLAKNPATESAPKALIAPHAGYLYSGAVAARAYNCLPAGTESIRRVVLLGPAHRVALHGLALPTVQAFRTPLGDVPLDQEAMEMVAHLPQVSRSDAPHRLEHSLEVQLPFLQTRLHSFALVPLVAGWTQPGVVAEVLQALWGHHDTLIVISSDLSHYHPYETARRMDADTAQSIETGQIPIASEQACGAHPINGLLRAAREHNLKIQRLDLRNSGDTAGDRRRVVGYGAWAYHEA